CRRTEPFPCQCYTGGAGGPGSRGTRAVEPASEHGMARGERRHAGTAAGHSGGSSASADTWEYVTARLSATLRLSTTAARGPGALRCGPGFRGADTAFIT